MAEDDQKVVEVRGKSKTLVSDYAVSVVVDEKQPTSCQIHEHSMELNKGGILPGLEYLSARKE